MNHAPKMVQEDLRLLTLLLERYAAVEAVPEIREDVQRVSVAVAYTYHLRALPGPVAETRSEAADAL